MTARARILMELGVSTVGRTLAPAAPAWAHASHRPRVPDFIDEVAMMASKLNVTCPKRVRDVKAWCCRCSCRAEPSQGHT